MSGVSGVDAVPPLHLAGAAVQVRGLMSELAVHDAMDALGGEPVPRMVNPEALGLSWSRARSRPDIGQEGHGPA